MQTLLQSSVPRSPLRNLLHCGTWHTAESLGLSLGRNVKGKHGENHARGCQNVIYDIWKRRFQSHKKIPSINWSPLNTSLHTQHFFKTLTDKQKNASISSSIRCILLKFNLKQLLSEFKAFACCAKLSVHP